jgi:glycosyltransferase involved in cell wall biosynthesis
MTKTLVLHFARYGPYHYARLKAAAEVIEPLGWQVVGLETAGTDATYAWDETKRGDSERQVITAFPTRVHEEITPRECRRGLHPLLDEIQPDAVAIAGWGSMDARACLDWCRHHHALTIVMSETREADGRRVWWREWLKSRLISHLDGALVGGKSHRDYLVKLGLPKELIRYGYNVVDNAYFRAESAQWRVKDQQLGLVIKPYILASNRFVERKNLIRLVQAYSAVARTDVSKYGFGAAPDLCLVGDGPEHAKLQSTCQALDLPVVEAAPWEEASDIPFASTGPRVFLPGFRQIEELPRFYAHACCFVHPAISEPWGLVINEAMACGLPVLCSSNCGAAEELLIHGVNGFKFNPLDTVSLFTGIISFLNLSPEQKAAMGESSAHTLDRLYPTEAFGAGLIELIKRPALA